MSVTLPMIAAIWSMVPMCGAYMPQGIAWDIGGGGVRLRRHLISTNNSIVLIFM